MTCSRLKTEPLPELGRNNGNHAVNFLGWILSERASHTSYETLPSAQRRTITALVKEAELFGNISLMPEVSDLFRLSEKYLDLT